MMSGTSASKRGKHLETMAERMTYLPCWRDMSSPFEGCSAPLQLAEVTNMQDEIRPTSVGWTVEEKVSPEAHLRQGDLIAFQSDDSLRQFGLVVTADCDLLQRKHARLVTLVPVVRLVDIVECYLLPELCERNRDGLALFVSRQLGVSTSLALPEEVEELRAKVDARMSDVASKSICLAARILMHEVERLGAADYRELFQAAGLKVGNLDQRLEQQVRSKGDILPLPQLKTLGIAADIAWVRHLWQVPLKQVVFRTSQIQTGYGQRVARLESPYRYRLTQLMGQVFSDIGLPNETRAFSVELSQILV